MGILGTATVLLFSAAVLAAGDEQPTLYLGKISVTGQQKILSTLKAIKLALHTPFSNDPAHADDMVCRIDKGLGEEHEYLDCATNRNYTRRRDAVHTAGLTGTTGIPVGGELQMFNALIATQPEHSLHVQVQGGALQALLARIPADATVVVPAAATPLAPAAATQAVPAAATASAAPPALPG